MRIQAFDYSIDLLQAILWQYNDAAKLQSLLEQKQTWYDEQYSEFWEDWYRDVFDLRTANDFGLSVWAILLNIPLTITTNLSPSANIWGFGPYPTFTRASSGTYYDNAGLLVSAGNDVPRYAYDPHTLQYAGLLYEAAATNQLLRSQEFDNASWGKVRSTVTANATIAPDGTLTAEKLVIDATAANSHYVSQPTVKTYVPGDVVTFSYHIKKSDYNFHILRFITGGAIVSSVSAALNLVTGVISGVSAGISTHLEILPNGYYRFGITFTCTGSGVVNALSYLSETGTITITTPTAGFGTFLWGAQLEDGPNMTSYIPTLGATAARAADLLTANTSGFRKNFNRGNFAPSTSGIKLTLAQKRLVLQLRYFQLVTRGAIPEINRFLNYVFADFGKVYVLDGLDMSINYVFTFLPPSQLRFVLESFDVLPRPAAVGVNYVVLVRDTFGFGPFHTNFNRGNFGSN